MKKDLRKRILYLVGAGIVLIIVAGIAAVLYLMHFHSAAQSGLPKNPAIAGVLDSVSANTVVITLQDSTQKTFTISPTTQIESQVKSGQVGESLAQIQMGTQVLVQPHAVNSLNADRVTVLSTPIVDNQDPAGPPFVLSGMLLATTTNSLTMRVLSSNQVLTIAFASDIEILSNVLAGQPAKTLNDAQGGMYIEVYGVTSTKGLIAKNIQLLVPLAQ